MGFPSKMSVFDSIAKTVHDDGEYVVTITVERHDNKPITPEQAEAVLTRTVPILFIQRKMY